MSDFFQEPPRLCNTWDGDPLLRSLLAALLPPDVFAAVEPHLRHLGERAATDLLPLAAARRGAAAAPRAFRRLGPPRRPHRALARRGAALKRVAAEEGLVATGYERAHGAVVARPTSTRCSTSSIPSAATYICPLAMTDGARAPARTAAPPALAARALPRLLAPRPRRASGPRASG